MTGHSLHNKAHNDNSPENGPGKTAGRLVRIFEGAATPVKDIALAVIDVQEVYCDPAGSRGTPQTLKTADKIASIAPQFRAAGVDLYVFYFGYGGSGFDPFKFVPDVKRDVILEKHQDSAFMSDIKIYDPDRVTLKRDFFHKILERSGKSVLLTCGFNLSACVKKTALDAKKHIGDVILLEDLAADGRGASESLTKSTHNALRYNGVHLAKSAPLLKAIQGPSGMSAPSRSVA